MLGLPSFHHSERPPAHGTGVQQNHSTTSGNAATGVRWSTKSLGPLSGGRSGPGLSGKEPTGAGRGRPALLICCRNQPRRQLNRTSHRPEAEQPETGGCLSLFIFPRRMIHGHPLRPAPGIHIPENQSRNRHPAHQPRGTQGPESRRPSYRMDLLSRAPGPG